MLAAQQISNKSSYNEALRDHNYTHRAFIKTSLVLINTQPLNLAFWKRSCFRRTSPCPQRGKLGPIRRDENFKEAGTLWALDRGLIPVQPPPPHRTMPHLSAPSPFNSCHQIRHPKRYENILCTLTYPSTQKITENKTAWKQKDSPLQLLIRSYFTKASQQSKSKGVVAAYY